MFQRCGPQIRPTRKRHLGQQTRLHPFRHWPRHRSGERLEVPLPLLQEWRRRLLDTVLPDADPGWNTHVLYGAGDGTDADDRWVGSLQDCADFQR